VLLARDELADQRRQQQRLLRTTRRRGGTGRGRDESPARVRPGGGRLRSKPPGVPAAPVLHGPADGGGETARGHRMVQPRPAEMTERTWKTGYAKAMGAPEGDATEPDTGVSRSVMTTFCCCSATTASRPRSRCPPRISGPVGSGARHGRRDPPTAGPPATRYPCNGDPPALRGPRPRRAQVEPGSTRPASTVMIAGGQ